MSILEYLERSVIGNGNIRSQLKRQTVKELPTKRQNAAACITTWLPVGGLFLVYGAMTRVAIRFVDDYGKPTDDYVDGIPVVAVNIYIGLSYQNTAGEIAVATTLMKRVDALVNTGANTTMITKDLVGNLSPLGEVPTNNQAMAGIGDVYGALAQIDGLDRPHPIEVGLAHLIPGLAMLLGRDIISKYRLVFDAPRKEFYLEL